MECEGQETVDTEAGSRWELDEAALGAYLARSIADFRGPAGVRKFQTGQSNPTYRIDTPSGALVLRRKPVGKLIRSAHAIDRECRVLRALASSAVPVPRALHYCSDASVIGSEFYVMEFVQGRIFTDAAMGDMVPTERALCMREMMRCLAAIHRVDVRAVGLADFGAPGAFYARQMSRLARTAAAQQEAGGAIAHLDALLTWFRDHMPADVRTLVHGDFKMDNVVFHPTDCRVVAVLDWELATLGHPLADVANCMLPFYLPPGVPLLPSYRDADPALGIPSMQQQLDWYCEYVGSPPIREADWRFAAAFALFKMAVIVQGVAHRARRGQASSSRAEAIAQLRDVLANSAWQVATTGDLCGTALARL